MLTIGLISFEIGTGLPFLSVVRGDARKQVLVQPESIKAVKAKHHEVNVVFCFYCIGEQKMMPISMSAPLGTGDRERQRREASPFEDGGGVE